MVEVMLCSIGYEKWTANGTEILNQNNSVIADVYDKGKAVMMAHAPDMYRLLKNIIYAKGTTERLVIITNANDILTEIDKEILNAL